MCLHISSRCLKLQIFSSQPSLPEAIAEHQQVKFEELCHSGFNTSGEERKVQLMTGDPLLSVDMEKFIPVYARTPEVVAFAESQGITPDVIASHHGPFYLFPKPLMLSFDAFRQGLDKERKWRVYDDRLKYWLASNHDHSHDFSHVTKSVVNIQEEVVMLYDDWLCSLDV